uniref:D(1B) dopamine receptor n=1 Tax=Sparus aurata TaxID=8175 RepID=A0A671XHG7_SPAAU
MFFLRRQTSLSPARLRVAVSSEEQLVVHVVPSKSALRSDREELPAHRALTGCVLALLIIWTLVGNFTVCAAVFRFRHLRAKVTNIFIVSLALSDLLVAVLVMPWKAVAEVAGFWPFGGFCKTWLACDIMCSTASILNLCVISVDRYWAISNPFRYERRMNKKVAYVMIGVTWTVSVVISFVPVQLNWHRPEIGDPAAEGLAPHGESVDGSCDSKISANSYQSHIRLHPDPQHSTDSHRELKVSIRKETKVLKTLSIIIGVFVCCWLPFFLLNCALPFCPGPDAPGAQRGPYCVSEKTFDVFVWIGWSNSSLNPIIYAFNADFRDAFLRLLRCRGRSCCAAVSAAVETVMARKEATRLKQVSPLNVKLSVSSAVRTGGSEDSGNSGVTVFYHRGTASEQVTDTEESNDKVRLTDANIQSLQKYVTPTGLYVACKQKSHDYPK